MCQDVEIIVTEFLIACYCLCSLMHIFYLQMGMCVCYKVNVDDINYSHSPWEKAGADHKPTVLLVTH